MFTWRRLFSLRNRALLMVGLPLLSILSLFTPLFSSNTYAVTTGDLQKKAEVWVALEGIVIYPEDLKRSVSAGDVNSCNFIEDQNSIRGPRLTSSNLSSIGMTCADIAKAIGYTPPSGSQSNYTLPDRGISHDEILNSLSKGGINSAEMFYGGNLRTGEPSNAIGYAIASNLLKTKCSVSFRTELLNPIPAYNADPANNQRVDWMKEGGTQQTPLNDDSADSAEGYHFWMWTYENGKVSKNIYWAGSTMDDYFDIGSGAKFLINYQTGPRDATEPWQADCYQAGRLLQDNKKYADGYYAIIKPGSDASPGTCLDRYEGMPQQLDACDDGFKNKSTPSYCEGKYPAGILRDACLYGHNTATGGKDEKSPPPTTDPGGGDSGEAAVTCKIDGIGWIVCPIANFLAMVTDGAYTIISTWLLEVEPLSTDQSSGTFVAWSTMRNFANVAFVIAFLIVIFSQITGAGISNYGIKKMLPRLIVAAILVNVSYWICAIAVDISNILGDSLYSLLLGVRDGIALNAPSGSNWSTGAAGWQSIVGPALAGTLVPIAMFFVLLSALLPMLVIVLATIITVFLALLLRQALIIILIVVSPLAFVAYLLPNTENLFKSWRSVLQLLLLMYPIIAVVFGGSALASTIIMMSSNGDILIQIGGAAVGIIPLIAAPALIGAVNKVANRFGLPNVGVKMEGMKKGAQGIADRQKSRQATRALNGSRLSSIRSFGRHGRGAKREAIAANLKAEQARAAKAYVANAAVDANGEATRFGRQLAGGTLGNAPSAAALQRALAGAKFTIEQAEADEVKAYSATIDKLDEGQLMQVIRQEQAKSPKERSDTKIAAAVDRLVKVGGPQNIESMVNTYGSSGESNVITKTLANSLKDNGPGFLKASDIDNIGRGQLGHTDSQGRAVAGSMEEIAITNVSNGVYSEKKLAGATNDELRYVSDVTNNAASRGNVQAGQAVARLKQTADNLLNNDTLKGEVKHNVDSITNLASRGSV